MKDPFDEILDEGAEKVITQKDVFGDVSSDNPIDSESKKIDNSLKNKKSAALKDVILTDDAKDFVKNNYSKLDVTQLVRAIFNKSELDARSVEGKAVRLYISEIGGVEKKRVYYVKGSGSNRIELTDDHKKFIEENIDSGMRPLEIAKILFEKPGPNGESSKTLSFNSMEAILVGKYMKELRSESVDPSDEIVVAKEFEPPRSIMHLAGWVNEYVPQGDPDKLLYPVGAISLFKPHQKNELYALMSYLRTYRFIIGASKYERVLDRKLFISTFIRFCYDKPDLTAEEVDQYISAAVETVNIVQIERTLQRYEDIIETSMVGDSDSSKAMSLKWLELVNQMRSKLDSAKERLKKLIDVLAGSRSDRIKNQVQRNSSVISLLMAWINEERRKEMLDLAKKEQREDGEEYEKLKTLGDLYVLVAGQTKNETIYGLQ